MKTKHIKTVIILGVVLSLTSCFEEELTLIPSDGITDELFWVSEENAEAALIPIYRGRSYWRLPSFAWEFYGDPEGTGCWSGPANAHANQFSQKSVTPDNEFINAPYSQMYGYINQANLFLNNVDVVEFRDPLRKEAAKGEAKFMRAMYYFYMNMIWGGVPNINFDPIPLYPERETEEEIYRIIIEDLEWAIDNLPDRNIGVLRPGEWECRPDKYSAKALLAKVLMTASAPHYDLDRALGLINEVIDSPNSYELEPFYGDIMMVENKDNSENIFLINFTSKMNHPFDGSNAASLAVPGQVWFRATPEFYNMFEDGDTRRDVNINFFLLYNDYFIQKMGYDERAVNGFTYDSYPQYILRLADIYLLKAEALAKKNFNSNIDEACSLVELVRDRAFQGAPHKVYTSADFSTFDEFWEFLWWERRKELFFECHTFFDAKRMDLCQDMLGLEEWQEVLPFSTSDITLNPSLKQNFNY